MAMEVLFFLSVLKKVYQLGVTILHKSMVYCLDLGCFFWCIENKDSHHNWHNYCRCNSEYLLPVRNNHGSYIATYLSRTSGVMDTEFRSGRLIKQSYWGGVGDFFIS